MKIRTGQVFEKNTARDFTCSVFATLLAVSTMVSAQAQVAASNQISCSSASACKTNFIPVFTSNGGAAKAKNSIVKQSGSAITVAGNVSAHTSGTNPAISGTTSAPSGTVYGLSGSNQSASAGFALGAGVYGQTSTSGESGTGSGWAYLGAGVWGDGGLDGNYGVLGTADDHAGGIFENNGSDYYALFAYNGNPSGYLFGAYNAANSYCYVDPTGSLYCSGSKNAVVPIDEGRHKVALAAIESPKNWFEDFGSEHLSGGAAIVQLESKFAQTVNTNLEYHVFVTPNGDCRGLYVSQKTPTSFEVHELGGGTSSVKFDYRIVALRKNFENIRLSDQSRVLGANKMGRALAQK